MTKLEKKNCAGTAGAGCNACSGSMTCQSGACACDFFATESYSFDASGLDWTQMFNVVVTVVQYKNGAPSTDPADKSEIGLNVSTPTGSATFYGCAADVDVTRIYNYQGGATCCTLGPQHVTGKNAFTIPASSAGGTQTQCTNSCTAPSL